MVVDIFPQTRLQNNGSSSDLGIRITLSASGKTKDEKKELRDLWEKIEDSNDIGILLDTIRDFSNRDKAE